MTARTDLANAASTVEGITGHPFLVQSTTPGTVFIRLERIDYPNPFGGVAHWNVVLILPQDQATAEQYLEGNLDQLRDALAPHLAITSVVPTRLDIPGVGTLLTAFINGHRED